MRHATPVLILIILTTAALSAPPTALEADNWVYWLQDIVPAELISCRADIAVIDYSADGTDATAFSRQQIAAVADSGTLPLAYLSIGEAEEYRFYWQPDWEMGSPAFLGPENPDWPGNYKVRYWDKQWWRTVIRPYLNRIIDAGFRGVYLDIIDAYWYWSDEDAGDLDASVAAKRMIKLVRKIAKYSRKRAGDDFIICPQNGLSILDDAAPGKARRYLKTINAVGLEDLFFNSEPEDQDYRMLLLKQVADRGLTILNVEYIPARLSKDYADLLASQPYPIVPLRAEPDRELDELIGCPVPGAR